MECSSNVLNTTLTEPPKKRKEKKRRKKRKEKREKLKKKNFIRMDCVKVTKHDEMPRKRTRLEQDGYR